MCVNNNKGFGIIEVLVVIAMLSIVAYGSVKITQLKQAQFIDNTARHQALMMMQNLLAMMHTLSVDYQAFSAGLYLNHNGDMIGPYHTENNRYNEQGNELSIAQMDDKYCRVEGCASLSSQADDDIATLYVFLNKLPDGELSISCDDAYVNDALPCSLGSTHHINLSWTKYSGERNEIALDIIH